jgi:hypothetical protein
MKKPAEYRICEFEDGNKDVWYQVLITKYYLFGLLPIRNYQVKLWKLTSLHKFYDVACYTTKEEARNAIIDLIKEDKNKKNRENIRLKKTEKVEYHHED